MVRSGGPVRAGGSVVGVVGVVVVVVGSGAG